MHVGTFTPEGTWRGRGRAAGGAAPSSASPSIEMMPVAEFPGRFGWGYDGVDLFAPTRLYGRRTTCGVSSTRAHALGIGVILDVVYNHLGPDGNYLGVLLAELLHRSLHERMGRRDQLRRRQRRPVARVLRRERRLLDRRVSPRRPAPRRDAADLRRLAPSTSWRRSAAACARRRGGRATIVVAENETAGRRASCGRVEPSGGYGLDALWNDDFHHTARGRADRPQRGLLHRLSRHAAGARVGDPKWGFLYQGQRYTWQKQRRGTPALDLAGRAFVIYLENHDQVANSARGARLLRARPRRPACAR